MQRPFRHRSTDPLTYMLVSSSIASKASSVSSKASSVAPDASVTVTVRNSRILVAIVVVAIAVSVAVGEVSVGVAVGEAVSLGNSNDTQTPELVYRQRSQGTSQRMCYAPLMLSVWENISNSSEQRLVAAEEASHRLAGGKVAWGVR
ncbi:hypothetical protein F7725_027355 [Dissostichus mawsoni]|uniref:Uncharacterized protein n=1 Tax=Dissostichus mawsoni TaxID=36200 RepID=A0A7J5XDX4_DISMA|nr:hypothetical protein F7725_027355 [Dissostichus mawsoni]